MTVLNSRRLRPVSEPSAPATDAVAEDPYIAGEVIGERYRLEREIGRGGMGVVWMAHSLVLGIDVAVKLIRAETAGPGLATRMSREAHAAARLGHPSLVRVFDFGWTHRGDPYLVMEFVQGETLGALIEREGSMPAIKAVQTLLPIADGLRLAHERSIVHRDIKPDNILLATDTIGRVQPKLLDFGIAKVEHTPLDGKLTQVGAILGSPEYMSPEQAKGLETVDARTDVWSLTIALYELLTGDTPFKGANYNALMQAIINDAPVPPRSGDNELWKVLSRGLAKDPDERFGSMSELGEALALWLYQHGVKEDLSGNSLRAIWLDRALAEASNAPLSEKNGRPRSVAMQRFIATVNGESFGDRTDNSRRRHWLVGGAAAAALLAVVTVLWSAQSSAPPANTSPSRHVTPTQVAQVQPNVAKDETTTPAASAASNVNDARGTDGPVVKSTKEDEAPSNETSAKAIRAKTTTSKKAHVSPKPKKPKHDFGF
jgi:eukaryotic-like serine/threonine-protein kinase